MDEPRSRVEHDPTPRRFRLSKAWRKAKPWVSAARLFFGKKR